MINIAIYGKGGIGKSTTVSNMSAALAEKGLTVMQIGCDPKADSTSCLCHENRPKAVLELIRENQNNFSLNEMIRHGYAGVLCVEAGGPAPGMGCAGRGIIAALEKLREKGAYEKYNPDVVFYDVLGDVVCGGFTMPMRPGYADKVFVITSGENMAIHAAANIATAVSGFASRNYASLGGIILNKRNVKNEYEKVSELADDINSAIIGQLEHSELVTAAEDMKKTVIEAFPSSDIAKSYRILVDNVLSIARGDNNA